MEISQATVFLEELRNFLKNQLSSLVPPRNTSFYHVENQATIETILLYRASNCKQTKEQGSEDYIWTHI